MASTTIQQFEDRVKAVVNRGSDYDADISEEVRKAAMFLERTNRFLYQQFSRPVVISPSTTSVDLLPGAIRIEAWWTQDSNGNFLYLVGMDPTDPQSNDDNLEMQNTLGHYYLDYDLANPINGVPFARANLNFTPSQSWSTTILESYLTAAAWPADKTKSHWLIAYGEDLMLHQVMMQMGPIVRDPELLPLHKPLRDEALLSVISVDEELRKSTQSLQMQFGG